MEKLCYPFVMGILIVECGIIVCAFFAEALFGFGGGLVSVPLLSTFIQIQQAVSLVLFFQVLMGVLVFKNWNDVEWSAIKRFAPGSIVGAVIGALSLFHLQNVFLQWSLAVVLVLFVAKDVFWKKPSSYDARGCIAIVLGVAIGICQGIFGFGGALFVLVMGSLRDQQKRMRATLICLFAIANVARFIITLAFGHVEFSTIRIAAYALPVFVLAIIVGQRIHTRISKKLYRMGINVLLLLSAIILILHS